MSFADVATIAVLGFIGVRVATGTRLAFTGTGRRRVTSIVRGLRLRHFGRAIVTLLVVVPVVVGLSSLPVLRWGWWTALGGVGNPATGTTDQTAGSIWEWIIPAVFIMLLVPALPLFAEAEERVFRRGSERRSRWQQVDWAVRFGLVHALIGIPIGAALGLSVGGWAFMLAYLREFRRTNDPDAALLESSRCHLAYNAVIVGILVLGLLTGGLTG